jgi:hypothetical protein
MTTEVARTKGLGFVHVRNFTTERWGAEGWQAVLERMRPSDRGEVAGALPIGWYPLALYARLLHALDEVHGTGDGALAVQSGRWQAEKDLTTIYRVMFRLLNPATVVVKTTDYWRKFHDSGAWDMQRTGDRSMEGTLEGWGVTDAFLCRELVGYFARLLELVGAKDPIVEHPECRARGDGRCHFRGYWGGTEPNTVESARGS